MPYDRLIRCLRVFVVSRCFGDTYLATIASTDDNNLAESKINFRKCLNIFISTDESNRRCKSTNALDKELELKDKLDKDKWMRSPELVIIVELDCFRPLKTMIQ